MERIVINDGFKSYEIVNQDGDVIGVFRFNPADSNILKRYQEVQDSLEQYAKKFNDTEATVELFNAAQDEIVNRVSELVGADTSKSFFSICGAFTPMADGRLYVETIMEAIGQVIQTEVNANMKKTEEHMNQYLKDYES